MTPLLWPVWWRPDEGSFSMTTTPSPSPPSMRLRAGAGPPPQPRRRVDLVRAGPVAPEPRGLVEHAGRRAHQRELVERHVGGDVLLPDGRQRARPGSSAPVGSHPRV